ncbi:MAG: NAD(P)/FAD-dependent oxidoreductase [Gallionella sp.]
MKKKIVIIGAGPAGLTAAYEFLAAGETDITVLEATDRIGGLSCTINHNGNRIDIGGHRFFSKSDVVMDWWAARMPIQGSPSRDDKILEKSKPWAKDGPDPEHVDRVMLIRERISRIFYLRKFFDYPISLKFETVTKLGIFRTAKAGFGYIASQLFKQPKEDSLEDFLINRFGKPLYRMFFEDYTEKVWGAHPKMISAAWGAQRIKGLSLSKAVLQALKKLFPGSKSKDLRQKNTETSLIEQFLYPKLGPGQIWECVADDIRAMGGAIHLRHKVVGIEVRDRTVVSVATECNGGRQSFACDYCISTMPIKDLIASMTGDSVNQDIQRIAHGLPYRDFMTVGVLVNRLKIRNETRIKTVGNIVPDTWIYIQEPDVKICRLQIFNNWSPYMVADSSKVWIGLEYMCSDQDDIWKMSDTDFIEIAVKELDRIGIVDSSEILDTCRFRIEKAYPAYFGTYGEFDAVKAYLDRISNLYCIGRNGQHRYNNQDHSMLTAMEAVRCIREGISDRKLIWSVNTEREYHEEKKS